MSRTICRCATSTPCGGDARRAGDRGRHRRRQSGARRDRARTARRSVPVASGPALDDIAAARRQMRSAGRGAGRDRADARRHIAGPADLRGCATREKPHEGRRLMETGADVLKYEDVPDPQIFPQGVPSASRPSPSRAATRPPRRRRDGEPAAHRRLSGGGNDLEVGSEVGDLKPGQRLSPSTPSAATPNCASSRRARLAGAGRHGHQDRRNHPGSVRHGMNASSSSAA